MPRFVRYLIAAVFCFVLLGVVVYATSRATTAPVWDADMYTVVTLNERRQGLDIRGNVPEISENFGQAHEALNDRIDSIVDTLIEGTRRIRARSVNFDYKIEHTSELISIVISANARAVTDRTTVMSLNFNHRGEIVPLAQAMGMNIAPLAEGKIAEMIRQDPATYNAAFSAPPTGQAFYMTNTHLVLLFDEFQLSSIPGGTSSIQFEIANIKSHFLPQGSYRMSTGRYAIRLIPLRTVLVGLGYSVRWEAPAREAVVSLNGETVIVLRPNENNYQLHGVLQRSLESAPIMFGSSMYVPISFFDQILQLTAFTIHPNGSITFISYLGR